jgi:hypothetical protein
MKTKTLIAACFGGCGIYLLITGTAGLVFALSMFFLMMGHFSKDNTLGQMVAPYAVFCIPFLVGAFFLRCASWLAGVVCRFARIEEDTTGLAVDPTWAITLACVVTGLVLAIKEIPVLVQLSYQKVVMAMSPIYDNMHAHDDFGGPLIRSLLAVALALLVIGFAKTIARRLVQRYERQA